MVYIMKISYVCTVKVVMKIESVVAVFGNCCLDVSSALAQTAVC